MLSVHLSKAGEGNSPAPLLTLYVTDPNFLFSNRISASIPAAAEREGIYGTDRCKWSGAMLAMLITFPLSDFISMGAKAVVIKYGPATLTAAWYRVRISE
jgi:hypothetical protein